MNSAIPTIGGKKARSKGGSLDSLNGESAEPMSKTMPKEAIAFAKQMGIDMTGIEAEAQDMWKMLTEMHDKDPLSYHTFVSNQMEEAKRDSELQESLGKAAAGGGGKGSSSEPKGKGKSTGSSAATGGGDKQSDSSGGKMFRPEAGFAIKTKTDGGDGVKIREVSSAGKDLYINICSHPAIQGPLDKMGRECFDDRMSADGLQIPLIVGPTRDIPLSGTPIAVDVVVHPSVVARSKAHVHFQVQIADLAIEWIKEETGIKIFNPRADKSKKKPEPIWTNCTNTYMGGRGEFNETPVLFPIDHAINQNAPVGERQATGDKGNGTVAAKASSGNSSLLGGDALSAPAALLNSLRTAKQEESVSSDLGINFSISSDAPNSKANTMKVKETKSLIRDLSEPDEDEAEKAARQRILQQEKDLAASKAKVNKGKPSIKKGFLSKASGSLYPEGSSEGTGGATGGTYAKFMSRCKVVDTAKMPQDEVKQMMEDHVKPRESPSPATTKKQTPYVVDPSKLAAAEAEPDIPDMTPEQKKEVLDALEERRKNKPPVNDKLGKQMDELMGKIDDDWGTDVGDDGIGTDEWNSVFKDLAKALSGPEMSGLGSGLAELMPNMAQTEPTATMKDTKPLFKNKSDIGDLQSLLSGVSPDLVAKSMASKIATPAPVQPPSATATKVSTYEAVQKSKPKSGPCFDLQHNLGSKIEVIVEEIVNSAGKKGVQLSLMNLSGDELSKADLQVADKQIIVDLGDGHRAIANTPFTLNMSSIAAKKSKKKGTLIISANSR